VISFCSSKALKVVCCLVQCPIHLICNGQASKATEWHGKCYVGHAFIKRFKSGNALAKEVGVNTRVLAKAFEDYHTSVQMKKDSISRIHSTLFNASQSDCQFLFHRNTIQPQ
jgi:hypothetical protein